jgi:hypothetical protein
MAVLCLDKRNSSERHAAKFDPMSQHSSAPNQRSEANLHAVHHQSHGAAGNGMAEFVDQRHDDLDDLEKTQVDHGPAQRLQRGGPEKDRADDKTAEDPTKEPDRIPLLTKRQTTPAEHPIPSPCINIDVEWFVACRHDTASVAPSLRSVVGGRPERGWRGLWH